MQCVTYYNIFISCCRFVKARTTYIGVSGSQHLFFKCHRDGKYKPKGNNIRKLKSLGTNKIGSHCPARMDVMVEGSEVSVLYIKTHVGHELEPKRLTLAKNEKDFLAEQLIMPNTNYNDILNVVKTLNSSSRLHHLTRKDLVTIKSSLKGTAKKNNTIKVNENGDKPNDSIEINSVFDGDLVELFDVQNNEKSTLLNSENDNVESQTNKEDLINVNNTLLTSDQIDLKNDFANKIEPMYNLNVEQQIIESNEPIPILEFNQEVSKYFNYILKKLINVLNNQFFFKFILIAFNNMKIVDMNVSSFLLFHFISVFIITVFIFN